MYFSLFFKKRNYLSFRKNNNREKQGQLYHVWMATWSPILNESWFIFFLLEKKKNHSKSKSDKPEMGWRNLIKIFQNKDQFLVKINKL